MSELCERAFLAAKTDQALTLHTMLADLDRPARKTVLNHLTKENDELISPLLAASRLGHLKTVRLMLTKFGVDDGLDVDLAGTVLINDHHLIRGATPLWCAAAAGNVEIVLALIRAGADVNKATAIKSTPLRAACFEGHLEVVQLLLRHKADLRLANAYNNTCLMIAAFKGHLGVVQCLLDYDANAVNDQARCGATALHYAAESGRLEIARLLLERGASLSLRNDSGLTALQSAAERCQGPIVTTICSFYESNRLNCIEALELAGASYANDKELYDPFTAYDMLRMAMEERRKSEPHLLKKRRFWPQYDNHRECETLEEIEELRFMVDELHLEGLCIRERILGPKNKELPLHIIYRGAVLADDGCFRRCQMLWQHALCLKRDMGLDVREDLMRFVDLFVSIHARNLVIKGRDILFVIEATVQEIEKIISGQIKIEFDEDDDICGELMLIFLYLLSIGLKLRINQDYEALSILERLTSQMANLAPRTRSTRSSLLHMAVDRGTSASMEQSLSTNLLSFPSALVTCFLLEHGFDVNVVDCRRRTALHIIAGYDQVIVDFQNMFSIVSKLVEHGVHTDVTDDNGHKALDLATCDVARVLIRSQMPALSLKALAANSIVDLGLEYRQRIPMELEKFIELRQ